MSAAVASAQWRDRRQRVFQSVFQTDITQPTPQSTPAVHFPQPGQAFGVPPPPAQTRLHGVPPSGGSHSLEPTAAGFRAHSSASPASFATPGTPASHGTAGDDQVTYDLAWHVVTARITLPPSASADDSFGTLAPSSQMPSQGESSEAEFYEALRLVLQAKTALPRATHTEDIVAWHTQQTRTHFAQHVLPLLSACAQGEGDFEADAEGAKGGSHYEKHVVAVRSSIRTIEGAQRMYGYGLELLNRGFARFSALLDPKGPKEDARLLEARFRRDVHALVADSASASLMYSVRVVLVQLVGTILGVTPRHRKGEQARPVPPAEDNLHAVADRERLLQLVQELYGVGLGGEKFQIVFAEVMDAMMSRFVRGAYAGIWTSLEPADPFRRKDNVTRGASTAGSSRCIESLTDWVENHFARLAFEVLSQISPPSAGSPVSLSDAKTYQTLALGRLASLRIEELFGIVLAWPNSQGALDDLRATITTPGRRLQLTDSFAQALQKRLLHPGRSTLEILRTYISIIRTFYALDHSKVLLSRVVPNLDLYLCHRDDAVRTVVTGLLASSDEVRDVSGAQEAKQRENEKAGNGRGANMDIDAGSFATPPAARAGSGPRKTKLETPDLRGKDDNPSPKAGGATAAPGKLVELAALLVDPKQARRGAPEDEDLGWDDMSWVPDPVDAGASYKRPKSEDVIGTLISALGSQDVFIKEFASVIAERLLGDPARFEQELRVLDLLKRRFGEQALQNCDVMVKDIQDSRKVDATILRTQKRSGLPALAAEADADGQDTQYHARILSRLFWPGLDREHFLLPKPVLSHQTRYEHGYEALKASRKLTWLNQLGQARVELEMRDRTVTVDCKTYEATVIYAFHDESDGDTDLAADPEETKKPAERSVEELYMELQMDEDLIASALEFWVSQGVLRRVHQDVYAVIETQLTAEEVAAEAAAKQGDDADAGGEEDSEAEAAERKSAKPAIDPKEAERRGLYWSYIKGMLTNSSATMPLAQMAMMLRMLLNDFAWGNEDLVEFLAEKVAEGDLEIAGGKYKLVKK
ncbi:hypothetical protein GQ53DRAFT_644851 [Thozetella sp. PMI_491]|nr:hypothetical protein GQ53DRAFT_644851 [Thozetella sp. PMI_491]